MLRGLGDAAARSSPSLAPLGVAAGARPGAVGLVPAPAGLEPWRPACRDPRRRALCARRQRLVVRGGGRAPAPAPAAIRSLLELGLRRRRAGHPDRLPRLPGARRAGQPRLRRRSFVPVGQPGASRPSPSRFSPRASSAQPQAARPTASRQLKRRIEIDWNAQRAARFIEEFEQAGPRLVLGDDRRAARSPTCPSSSRPISRPPPPN